MRWVFWETAQVDDSGVHSELCVVLVALEAVLSVMLY
jgi:hypothetical protein